MERQSRNEQCKLVDGHIRRIARLMAAGEAELAEWLREGEKVRIWEAFGHVSMVRYVEEALSVSPHTAFEKLRVARQLEVLKEIEAAMAEGALSFSAVKELTRVATPETERAWVDAAKGMTVHAIEQAVSGRRPGDGPEDPPTITEHHVRLTMSPETYALFRDARVTLEEECNCALSDDTLMRMLLERALQSKGESSTKPPYQIAITVCKECNKGWQTGAGTSFPISASAVEEAHCDAEYIDITEEGVRVKAHRSIHVATRRHVMRRDNLRCRYKNCRSCKFLHIHHIVYRANGGTDTADNLLLLCSGHHRMVHDGLITIQGKAPDGLSFDAKAQRAEPQTVEPQNVDRVAIEQVRDALVRLGFKKAQAASMLKIASHTGPMTTSELLKAALQSPI